MIHEADHSSDHYKYTCCPSVLTSVRPSPLFHIDQSKTDLHCWAGRVDHYDPCLVNIFVYKNSRFFLSKRLKIMSFFFAFGNDIRRSLIGDKAILLKENIGKEKTRNTTIIAPARNQYYTLHFISNVKENKVIPRTVSFKEIARNYMVKDNLFSSIYEYVIPV